MGILAVDSVPYWLSFSLVVVRIIPYVKMDERVCLDQITNAFIASLFLFGWLSFVKILE